MEAVYAAVGVNILVAVAAYRKKSVSRAGSVAGAVVGIGIWVAGGLLFWGLLLFFFVTSSLLSRAGRVKKRNLEKIHQKGDVRDAFQVWANSGMALVSAVLFGLTGQALFATAFGAALAAATADTWASEIGVLSRRKPISITSGRPVERGISGGITLLGTAAAFVGALLAALLFALMLHAIGSRSYAGWPTILIITVSGFGASLVDSLLGSTLQVHYINYEQGIITEKKVFEGRQLPRYRGFPWISNDTVNALSSLFAFGTSIVLHLLIIR